MRDTAGSAAAPAARCRKFRRGSFMALPLRQVCAAGSWRLAPWQAHGEHRTFARLARHGHVATHHARELAGDGEAETGAAEALSGGSIGLRELLEQLGLLFGGHADAGVGDGELDEVAAIAHLACRKLDFALFGELTGIAQQ